MDGLELPLRGGAKLFIGASAGRCDVDDGRDPNRVTSPSPGEAVVAKPRSISCVGPVCKRAAVVATLRCLPAVSKRIVGQTKKAAVRMTPTICFGLERRQKLARMRRTLPLRIAKREREPLQRSNVL
jgi:hypothetical protein